MQLGKFRVWCKDRQEWEKDEMCLLQDGSLMERKSGNIVNPETHKPVFYIGMEDKNKVEMYDGDIVHWTFIDPEDDTRITEDETSLIQYSEFAGSFQLVNKNGKVEFWNDTEMWEFEVLGNIFKDFEKFKDIFE